MICVLLDLFNEFTYFISYLAAPFLREFILEIVASLPCAGQSYFREHAAFFLMTS